jgi:glycosyltransferase involved in cell wall biosynthesis
MKIALFTYRLSQGAFALGYAALATGFWNLGIRDLYAVYLKEGPGKNVNFPLDTKFVPLNVNRALWSPVPLAKWIKQVKPDVLISMPAFINIAAILGNTLARSRKTKLIISERSTMSYNSSIERRNEIRWLSLPWVSRILYGRANGIVTNSEGVLEDLIQKVRIPIKAGRAVVIPPSVDLCAVEKFAREEPNQLWVKNHKKPIIISAGRLHSQKNFPLLIEAFKIVRSNVDARLVILGEGEERRNLEKLISEGGVQEVYLPGHLENPWSYIARSDVFVLSSEQEGFGRVLVESMACGVPVIATDAIGGGPREILLNSEYGLLVPRDEPEQLAQCIVDILTKPSLRQEYIERGKNRSQQFETISISKQWLSFIETISIG